jgi:RHS repeat-associated protein
MAGFETGNDVVRFANPWTEPTGMGSSGGVGRVARPPVRLRGPRSGSGRRISVLAGLAVLLAPLAGQLRPAPAQAYAGSLPSLSGGAFFSLAAQSNGTAWAWGDDGYGQLGNGTALSTGCGCLPSPSQVPGLTSVTQVAGGFAHSLALQSDGTVWSWGYNHWGQLGDGTTSSTGCSCVATPAPVSGLTQVTALGAGQIHSLAVRSDGTVWGWGDDGSDELGSTPAPTPGCTCSDTPIPVVGLSGVTAVAGGDLFSLALKSDGTVWGWGWNRYGQLGTAWDGANSDENVGNPTQVPRLTGVIAIAAGFGHSLALRSDGTVWAWGLNAYGQLGDGSTTDSDGPVEVSGLTGVTAIASGENHSLAMKSDGTVWAWGYNWFGELGDGTTTANNANPLPVKVSGMSGATAVAAGESHSLALRYDGTVWGWGWNGAGQVGNGSAPSTGCGCLTSATQSSMAGVAQTPVPQPAPDGGAVTPTENPDGQGNFCWPCFVHWLSTVLEGQWADPVNTAYGTFSETSVDIKIPGRVPLALTRTYNSAVAATNGALGYGWSFDAGSTLAKDPTTGIVTISQENGSQVSFVPSGSGYAASAPRFVATLTHNADGTWTLVRQARDRISFAATGQETSEADTNGYTTSMAYNSSGQLTTVTDPAARSLTFSYTGSHLTSVTDPIGRVVRFAYNDGAGNLTDVTDVNGGATHYTYDGSHRLLTMTDPRGAKVTNVYDSSSRVTSQQDAMGRTTTFAYTGDPSSGAGGMTTITDPKGNMSREQYQYGLKTALTRGVGTSQAATWSYLYDTLTLGLLVATDPNGHTTRYSYDANGNPQTIMDALGRQTASTYDSLNDLTSTTDAAGVTTTMTYDANGNLLTKSTSLVGSSPAQSATTSYTYGDATHPGDVTAMTDPDGKVWHYAYDADGDRTSATDPLGDQSTSAYNAVGWVTSTVSPKGNVSGCTCASQYTTSLSYTDPQTGALDGFGDVRTITDPLGHVTTRSYDADRNLASETDANGHATLYTYDLDNERTDSIRADGTDLHIDYFSDGTVKDQVDAAGNTTSYAYDALARETSQTTPVTTACPTGCTTTYTYDGAGNRLTVVDPMQQTTTYAYDASNELTSISYSDGKTPNVTGLAYDPDGRRTQMTDGTGTSHWAYDSLGRMTSYQNGAGSTVQYGYDLKGQLTAITYPNGKVVSRGYDDAGRFTSVTDWLGHTSTFTPDADSNVVATSHPNTVSASLGYDNADRLTSITDGSTGGGTLAGIAYQRDATGQVTSETDSGHLTAANTYSYTPINQLDSVNGGSYAYDAADNLTRQPSNTSQAFDAADELTATRSAISLVGTASGGDAGTSAAVTLPLPAGVLAGDQVILASTQAAADTVGAPAGYTQVGTATSGGSTPGESIVWRHTVVPGDTAVVIPYGGVFPKAAVLAVYRGVDATTPVDAQSSGGNAGGTSLTIPSVTTTTPADTLTMVSGATGNATAASWTPATGMTGETAMSTIPLVSSSLADQALPAAGGTGARTAIFGTSAQLAGVLVALRPATTATYTYDPRGDRTAVTAPGGTAATTYAYDQANRLTAFTGGSGASATYSYDGAGLRMAKTVVSGGIPTTTSFVWDDSAGMPQLLSDGTNSYIDGPLGPVEQMSSSGVADYYSTDSLGSTRMLTDASGAVAATFTFDAYGKLTSSTGTATTSLRWAGLVTDSESSLLYARARYYDPAIAEFTTVDPLVSVTAQPYGYVHDNPLNGADPSGMNSTSMSPDVQHCDRGGNWGGVDPNDFESVCGNGTRFYARHDIAPHDISPLAGALIIGAPIVGAACLFGGCEAAAAVGCAEAASGAATARYAAQATVAALGILGLYGLFSKSHDVGEPTDPGLPVEPGGFDSMPGPGPTATPSPTPTPTLAPVDGPFLPSPTPWGPWAPSTP